MDYFLNEINSLLNSQIVYIDVQLSEINSNQDPNLDANIAGVTSDALDAYEAYQANLDISDSGIATLTALNSSRLSQCNSRVAAIGTAKATYYDLRYQWSVDRCGFNGTLTQINALEQSKNSISDNNGRLQNKVDLYDSEF